MANNTITSPWYLFNGHLETIYPAIFRRVNIHNYERKRLTTPDEDFIDVDYYYYEGNNIKNKSVILCHGLEGNSLKPYITGMVKVLRDSGFNCVAWNFRGCSGVPNNCPHSYHSGATKDLDFIIHSTINKFPGTEIYLTGFSLGGNLILKYLGERTQLPNIKKAVAISAPIDLHSSCLKISKKTNWLYSIRFLHSLKKKIKTKAKIFPDQISVTGLNSIKTLEEFDDLYTAPLHGFKDAFDYYSKCSSIHYLRKIQIPTLVINARNDPFLSEKCYPIDINREFITYDYPKHGGHLGFKMFNSTHNYYHEIRTVEFLSK